MSDLDLPLLPSAEQIRRRQFATVRRGYDPDQVHDYRDPEAPVPLNEPERFAANYRKAGGAIELLYIDNAARQSAASYDPIAAFLLKHMPVKQAETAMAK